MRLTPSRLRCADFGSWVLVDGSCLARTCGGHWNDGLGTKPGPAADHRKQAQLPGTLKVFGMVRSNRPDW